MDVWKKLLESLLWVKIVMCLVRYLSFLLRSVGSAHRRSKTRVKYSHMVIRSHVTARHHPSWSFYLCGGNSSLFLLCSVERS